MIRLVVTITDPEILDDFHLLTGGKKGVQAKIVQQMLADFVLKHYELLKELKDITSEQKREREP